MGIHEASTVSGMFVEFFLSIRKWFQPKWLATGKRMDRTRCRKMPKDAELWTCYDDFLLKIFWIPIAFLSNLLVSIGFLSQDAGFQFLFVWICVWHLKRWNGAPVGSPKHGGQDTENTRHLGGGDVFDAVVVDDGHGHGVVWCCQTG